MELTTAPARRNSTVTDLESPGKPDILSTGDGFNLIWPCGVTAEVERIAEHRDELTAEVTIQSSRMPAPGLLHSARVNLLSSVTRKGLAQALQAREPDIDWGAVVEGLCFLVKDRYRQGDPSIDMRAYQRTEGSAWLVEPFIERSGCTVIFADGGTGKSLSAMAIACSLSSMKNVLGQRHGELLPVLYIDWEVDANIFKERLDALLAGAGIADTPPIYYRRQVASLHEAAPTLRKEVVKLGVGLVVVDSLGPARGGEPESAEATIKLFNAARSLGVPWLALDHVTKAQGNESTRPFGSTYTHNLARLTWGLDKAQHEGDDSTIVSWVNHKRNNGRLLNKIGLRIAFDGDADTLRAVRINRVNLLETDLSDKLPLHQRISFALKSGPKTAVQLCEELGAPIESVRRAIQRGIGRNFTRMPDGMAIALLAREG